jgi:multiple sugar transport system permease protein
VTARVLTVLAGALFAAPALLLLAVALRLPSGAATTAAFAEAFALVPLTRALLNSAWICALAVPAAVALSSVTAFGLTQIGERARARLLLFLLLSASVPLTAVLIPRFVLFEGLGMVGTPLPLLMPALAGGTPLACLLLYAGLRRVPQPQIDAARVEGLGWLAIWWRVAVPQTRPTHGAVLLLVLLSFWGAFLEPLLYLHDEHELTAPLMLHAIALLGSTQWPLLMAAAAVVTLPVAIAVAALAPFLHHPFRSH